MVESRDRYFKNGKIHHAIHHDLGLSLTIFSLHSTKYCIQSFTLAMDGNQESQREL